MNSLCLLAAVLFTAAPPAPAVTLSADHNSAVLGQTLSLESAVNAPARSTAHLNVTSLDGVYVDLEDWTKDVTQPVPAGSETQLSWEVQAVNSGRFAIYVVLIPPDGPLIASPAVEVTVAARQTLDTGGALPVAITMPVLLGLIAVGTRLRAAG